MESSLHVCLEESLFSEAMNRIISKDIFRSMAAECVKFVLSEPLQSLHVFVDAETSAMVPGCGLLQEEASGCQVFGFAFEENEKPRNVVAMPALDSESSRYHVLVLLSPSVSIAMISRLTLEGARKSVQYRAGWTCDRAEVVRLARRFCESGGQTISDSLAAQLGDAQAFEWNKQMLGMFTKFSALVSAYADGRERDLSSVLSILKAISGKRRSHDVLFVFVERIAQVLEIDRCSVVRVWGSEDVGHVLASHDDQAVSDLLIDLTKYPEIVQSLRRFEKVVVEDAYRDPLTKPHAVFMRKAGLRAIVVVPILLLDPNVGSLFLRIARRERPFSTQEIDFCEVVSEAAANALERAQLFDSIQQANERLEHLAVTDELTGLSNHRYFRQRLEEEFERARRYRLPLTLVLFDIDNFKQFNDKYGHLQGDEILRELGSRTKRVTRRSDITARYGGEEFAIIMPLTGPEGASSRAERLRHEVATTLIQGLPAGVNVTVSIGIGELEHDKMMDCEALIRAADIALYEAKARGKNQVVVANHQGE
ncbi:MAG: sensor domain-containing diguanylate cyclase [Candidatus Hydrogenedentes bacterium]|nr:sensor domain-containing diguanylate cyclase [Candidatus Hydrogenedentota bacterium]